MCDKKKRFNVNVKTSPQNIHRRLKNSKNICLSCFMNMQIENKITE